MANEDEEFFDCVVVVDMEGVYKLCCMVMMFLYGVLLSEIGEDWNVFIDVVCFVKG